ncbi:hypothetical protein ACFL0X_00105 [Nanoarchaeota archaeon]
MVRQKYLPVNPLHIPPVFYILSVCIQNLLFQEDRRGGLSLDEKTIDRRLDPPQKRFTSRRKLGPIYGVSTGREK